MKFLFTFFLACCVFCLHAQMRGTGQIVMLHPSVGNTITLSEKQKFGLFTQQPDSTFEMAQVVKYDDSTYTVLFRTIRDGRTERSISTDELLQMYIKIESIQPAPQLAPAPGEKKTNVKNEIPALDLLGSVIHASAQILVLIAEFNDPHHNNSGYSEKAGKYDPAKSYETYPQDHYIPKEGEGN